MNYIGFDIGGSSVKAALVRDRQIVKSQAADLPSDLSGLLELLGKIFADLSVEVAIGGAGFGFPGTMDLAREIMLKSPNISYLDNQPLKKLLTEKFKPCPIKLEHDAHCFLLAEQKVGLAKDLKNVFYLTLGSGVGGAWMVNGKIVAGEHGAAGEVAHSIVDISDGLELEELAANKFIKKELGLGSLQAYQLVQSGDKRAREVFESLGKNLGVGIANIINIFDPEAVILSGGIGEAEDLILPGIKEGIDKFVTSPAAKQAKILFSRLGRFGGALGAALLFE
ncbi:MAG TPA: hypothetical protein DHI91_01805 [Candidatus Portnoybacteria bacterium]|nr:hypothetical protein [Candidatus Portnoybacteria bacterium]